MTIERSVEAAMRRQRAHAARGSRVKGGAYGDGVEFATGEDKTGGVASGAEAAGVRDSTRRGGALVGADRAVHVAARGGWIGNGAAGLQMVKSDSVLVQRWK
jgi:hypothetical protein